MYNAYEKDIALVNIYFGDSTVLGKTFPTNLLNIYGSKQFNEVFCSVNIFAAKCG